MARLQSNVFTQCVSDAYYNCPYLIPCYAKHQHNILSAVMLDTKVSAIFSIPYSPH